MWRVALLAVVLVAALAGALFWLNYEAFERHTPTPADTDSGTGPSTGADSGSGSAAAGDATATAVNIGDVIKATATELTVLGATLAGIYAYRRQRLAEGDAHRADDTQLAERYTTAAEQLGHEQAAVRLAGVYAMARLADDWPEQRQVCIDVLCAYLRMPYQPDPDQPGHKHGEREVRLTIISVIRDHLQDPAAPTSWSTHRLDFTGATFDGGDLSGSHFHGTVHFDKATFTAEQVSFDTAEFAGGQVSFDGAAFTEGRVSFDWARFTEGGVSFGGAEFTGSQVSFGGAEFAGGWVFFDGAEFAGGRVSFGNAEFAGDGVSSDWARFTGGAVSFDGARFTGGAVTWGPVPVPAQAREASPGA